MGEVEVSQAQPDQQPGQLESHLTLHWFALKTREGKIMELLRFAYQVYISISHLNCAWLALMVSLVRIIEVRPNISITGHS